MTSNQADEAKGRIKEAAGALTDNDDLKREGKRDQAASTAKKVVDKAHDKIEQGIDAVRDKVDKD
ncbi:MAG: CsbD family protein [Actinomycetota bacterium]|nr:CsbD family protein [Actinomycetota bacterium]